MNFYAITAKAQQLLSECDIEYDVNRFLDAMMFLIIVASVSAALLVAHFFSLTAGYIVFAGMLIAMPFLIYAWLMVKANRRAEEIENMLPNFLSMMASNIRSGITYDRALLLSTRKEFGPLAKEIDRAAKQTVGGKPLTDAMMDMARRSRSETFAKTMRLIVEGTEAGGNLAEMLEITAIEIRQASSLKKEITATIQVYRLFIYISSMVGAPALYALTGFLVQIFISIRTESPASSGPVPQELPMMGGGQIVSPELFFWYSITAITFTTILSSFASGAITKGKETEGLSDLGWMFMLSFGVFFGLKLILGFLLSQLAFGI